MFFLCTLEICFHLGEKWISFPVNASTVISSPLRRSLYYCQLTAVKYPCSSRSQIPLRQKQSITHSVCPSPSNSRNHKCVFLSFWNTQICPVKPQASQSSCLDASEVLCLSSHMYVFDMFQSQLKLFSDPEPAPYLCAMPTILFASTPSPIPKIRYSLFWGHLVRQRFSQLQFLSKQEAQKSLLCFQTLLYSRARSTTWVSSKGKRF